MVFYVRIMMSGCGCVVLFWVVVVLILLVLLFVCLLMLIVYGVIGLLLDFYVDDFYCCLICGWCWWCWWCSCCLVVLCSMIRFIFIGVVLSDCFV